MFKFFQKVKKSRAGYTLTELIVVVAILGVLAAIGIPMVMNSVQNSKDNADKASIKAIETAVQMCLADGSLKIDGTSKKIVIGTSSLTSIADIVEEKLVGKAYPECNATSAKTWYLDLANAKVYTATAAGYETLS